MKRAHLLVIGFLLLFFNQGAYAQEVPTIFPASPEAATLGKYGDIPINLSTGRINYAIPIYSIQESGYTLPINLSYNYSGLMIDDIPGCTGLGWSLNAGGLITRQVRGRPDEDTNGYVGTNPIGINYVIPYMNQELSEQDELLFLDEASKGVYDTQPDKFVINIGGVQANFYFNENKEIFTLPNKPYRIELINNDFSIGFKVIDESGVQYFFEDKEYSKRKRFSSVSDIVATPVNGYVSSWKITKIVLTTGKEITFDYIPYRYYQRFRGDSFQKTQQDGNNDLCASLNSFGLTPFATHYELDTKIIQKITFPKGEVNFNVATTITTDTDNDYNKYLASLDQITIKNQNQETINTFDFTYDNLNKTRKLLNKVVFNNDITNSYELTYYGVPSDGIAQSQQDFWGYYNNNTTGRFIDFNNLYQARTPDFNQSRIGALKTIQYPTNGITEIEYEANTYDPGPTGDDFDDFIVNSGECAALTESLSVNANIFHGSTNTNISDVKTFTVTSNDFYFKINLNVTKNATFGEVTAGLRRIDAVPPPTGITSCEDLSLEGCEECYNAGESIGGGFAQSTIVNSFNSSKQQRLYPGTYELYATATGGALPPCDNSTNFTNGCQSLLASATISFSNGTTTAIPRSREVGGIRVSKVTSCPSDNSEECIRKQYVYEDNDGVSRGFLFRRRNLFTHETFRRHGSLQCVFLNYGSSSNTPLGTFFGSHIVYDKVREYTIDNQGNSNGEKTIIFRKVTDNFTPQYPFIETDHKEWYNGKTLSEEYKNSDGEIVMLNSSNYFLNNSLGNGNIAYSMKIGKHTAIIPTGNLSISNPVLSDFGITFSTFDSRAEVDLIKSRSESNYYNGKEVNVTTDYYYDNPKHLQPTKMVTTKSNDNPIITNIYYPDDIINTSSLGESLTNSEKSIIDNLKQNDLHRVAMPIQIDSYEDHNNNGLADSNELLNRERTLYEDWGNNIYLPEFIKIIKGTNTLENRLTYYKYDDNGNPLEVSRADGAHIVYLWGYNQQYPVAKIENTTLSEVATVLNLSESTLINNGITNLTTLNTLRTSNNLSNVMISTYIYNPLVGVTSMTDPSGYRMSYEYDTYNRLKRVKDQDGNIISENAYHYKGTN